MMFMVIMLVMAMATAQPRCHCCVNVRLTGRRPISDKPTGEHARAVSAFAQTLVNGPGGDR